MFTLSCPVNFYEYPCSEGSLFSILIPSWKNYNHLKLVLESIEKNSAYVHQVCVHLNEGDEQSKHLLDSLKISHSVSKENTGVCFGFNLAYSLAKCRYIVLMDDDMYVAPEWDKHLYEEIRKQTSIYWCLSGTMIERRKSGNSCVICPYNYGESPENFQEEKFLAEYSALPHRDWTGSMWYPLVVEKKLWDMIGGLSTEFSPGMYSDPDFMMKLWQAGVRDFKGISQSRVYHFISKSTVRVKKNNGRKQFLLKWGMSSSTFTKYYLRLGQPYERPCTTPDSTGFKRKLWIDKLKVWCMR
ncbi:MAG: glycosyltransferase [Cytophagaceae bacterium]|nr:glycosyltransferase [Cytophagaceae bacterium]MDW8456818.1 glycosyltransferase [Cytophagaceae bacterium]